MQSFSITILIEMMKSDIGLGNEQRIRKWSDSVCGADGSIYGIPHTARRVMKFNPTDSSSTLIGPDFGDDEEKWSDGVLARNGAIYCIPYNSDCILKIDTISGIVTTVKVGRYFGWISGALALDHCIYFMPYNERRILKLDTSNDKLSTVGSDLGGGRLKYLGTVVSGDGFVYGIPFQSERIIKYDPRNDAEVLVGEEAEQTFDCGPGALARDGHIYAADYHGDVLKIDTTNDSYCFIHNTVNSETCGWGNPVSADDGCIYWPPDDANHVLKLDSATQTTSLSGNNLGDEENKWTSGAISPNGIIYCIPACADQILVIDPMQEFAIKLKKEMQRFPQNLGLLFERNNDGKTNFDFAVYKYGKRVFQVVLDCVQINDLYDSNTPAPFMVAASHNSSALGVIYLLLRANPSLVK